MGAPASATSEALFGKARRAVLAMIFGRADEQFYVRQIARAAGAGQGAVHRELKRLTEAGIVLRTTKGQQVYYQANQQSPIFQELKSLFIKTAGVGDLLREVLAPLGKRVSVAFIYGSLARGQENARSDVDVMVIGKATFGEVVDALHPVQDRLGREVNPTVYPPAEFRAKLAAKHHFLTTVMREPKVFLIGETHDLARLAE
jgi:predicted nucleotidyltransferase